MPVFLVSSHDYEIATKSNVQMLEPSPAHKRIFRNWAIVSINPKNVKEEKVNKETLKITTPDSKEWLVPFAIGGIPMQAIYVLGVKEISIHNQQASSMCELCQRDVECIANGRSSDGSFKCPGGWDGLTHIRRSAR